MRTFVYVHVCTNVTQAITYPHMGLLWLGSPSVTKTTGIFWPSISQDRPPYSRSDRDHYRVRGRCFGHGGHESHCLPRFTRQRHIFPRRIPCKIYEEHYHRQRFRDSSDDRSSSGWLPYIRPREHRKYLNIAL